MVETTHGPQEDGPKAGGWGFAAFAAGGLALVIIALIAIPLAGGRRAELAPLTTPEGVAQHFFDATYRGDYTTAYGMLSEETRREVSLAEFQTRMRYERDSEMRVIGVVNHGETATVTVMITHYTPGGLFGGGEWSTRSDLLLGRDGDTWQIVGEPFW